MAREETAEHPIEELEEPDFADGETEIHGASHMTAALPQPEANLLPFKPGRSGFVSGFATDMNGSDGDVDPLESELVKRGGFAPFRWIGDKVRAVGRFFAVTLPNALWHRPIAAIRAHASEIKLGIMLYLIGGMTAVLALQYFGLLKLPGVETEPVSVAAKADNGVIYLATVPADAAVKLDGKPVDGALSPYVLRVAPGKSYQLEVAAEGHKPWTMFVQPGAGQELRIPPVVLPRLEAGKGEAVAEAATVSGSEPESATVTGAGSESATGTEPATGTDSVAAAGSATGSPGASKSSGRDRSLDAVGSDALRKREAPVAARKVARTSKGSVGKSKPTARKRAAPPPRRAAEPAAGMGTLRINSDPPSTIYIDGRNVGQTPKLNLQVRAGSHEITLVNSSLGIRKTFRVNVPEGGKVNRIVKL